MLTLEERQLIRIENLGTGMLGKKHSKKTKERMKKIAKGRKPSKKTIEAVRISNKLRGCSKKTKEKMRLARLGKPSGMLGKKVSEKTKKMISNMLKIKARRGENHPFWKGGISSIQEQIKSSSQYIQWRKEVFERDNWTCQDCKKIKKKIHPHHRRPFSLILRENKIKTITDALDCNILWDIENGITLCKDCHKKTDTYGHFKINELIQEFPKEKDNAR